MSDRRLFALSDPHLSFASPKPMAVFGPAWHDHARRLAENWRETIRPADIVLVPGDISWAMRLEEAKVDLAWLAALPGQKVIVKGNHDYWWQSLSKVKALGLPDMHFIQNNHLVLDGVAVGGTRLWDFPGINWPYVSPDDGEDQASAAGRTHAARDEREGEPEKIRARELSRLEASLAQLPDDAEVRVAMTHFPPLGEDGLPTPITDLISSFGIDVCVFGHIHAPGAGPRPGEDIVIGNTRYVLASCDLLGMRPKRVW